FEPMDKKHKIYSKKAARTPALHLPDKRGDEPAPRHGPLAPLAMGPGEGPVGVRAELDAQREADRITVNRFAPPGVLIDAELKIVQFRGSTGAYLEPPAGKASFEVLKMARQGLMLPLRAAINQAKKENKAARRENVRIEQNGKTRTVNLEVIPLKNLRERCFLILFEETEQLGHAGDNAPLPKAIEPRGAVRTPSPTAKEESGRVADLECEISEMRDYLQSIQEQYEAANEELQASSEEAQSTNEELQSINEELETSKEELESANEELTTVNEETGNRNAELNRIHGDLFNLQTSTKLAVVLLGRDLSIHRFSAQAEKQFDLLATDAGRPVSYLRHHLVFPPTASASDSPGPTSRASRARQGRASARNASPIPVGGLPTGAGESPAPGSIPRPYLETFIVEVIDTVREREREVQDQAGRWYSLRVRPYMTLDNKVDGAVLVLIDIDALKRSEHAIAAARDYAEAIVSTAPGPLLILNADLRVHTANEAFYNAFKVEPSGSEGRLIYELGNHQWNIPRLRELLEDILCPATVSSTTSRSRTTLTPSAAARCCSTPAR
ncbi:MAG: PAS domain-containing protein, partial [Gammaproteobacteria bacterium]